MPSKIYSLGFFFRNFLFRFLDSPYFFATFFFLRDFFYTPPFCFTTFFRDSFFATFPTFLFRDFDRWLRTRVAQHVRKMASSTSSSTSSVTQDAVKEVK